ncbi:outer membrane protein assembly factor BamB family protein [Couchioplanes azureus]|uniref:outer membrane protein assembly factor BamB family protein n=1 Tax=Couchioplanes caeruleus TaxID=56438 RepID=UPI00167142BD|nr:PQQ-binding-like beta-propeller repeat protein [Couchioplanes caeruleus]
MNIATGESETLPNNDTCTQNTRVVGNDGTVIYIANYDCGTFAVNPVTGSRRYIPAGNGSISIAGRYLYNNSSTGQVSRYDLQSGQRTNLFGTQRIQGTIVADDTHIWILDSYAKLHRRNLTTSSEDAAFELPTNLHYGALSVGDYIYALSSHDFVYRISKADGSTLLVAGDGAHADDLPADVTGIGTDGTRLYTSDKQGLTVISAATRSYAPPAAGPVLSSGTVQRFGPSQTSYGVTVLKTDGHAYAYTSNGTDLVQVDLAGGAPASMPKGPCSSGHRVVGNDGSLVYVVAGSCGMYAVSPKTGSWRYIPSGYTGSVAIAGRYLYRNDAAGQLWRYDLESGRSTALFGSQRITGSIAADNAHVWVLDYSARLHRLDATGNNPERQTFEVPSGLWNAPLSVGGYIYARSHNETILRISKADGSTQLIAGDGAHRDDLLALVNGIASDGTRLYTSDQQGLATISAAARMFYPTKDSLLLMPSAGVTEVATLPGTRYGLTVVKDFIYTASNSQISTTNLYTGNTLTVAGSNSTGCRDGERGADVILNYPRIIGNDGSLIYISEDSCGVRAVNPVTGSTRRISGYTGQSTIAGKYLYTLSSSGTLYQYGLHSGVTNVVAQGIAPGTSMAAEEMGDKALVWLLNGQTIALLTPADTGGKISALPIGGTPETTSTTLPNGVETSYVASASAALYVKVNVPGQPSTLALLAKNGTLETSTITPWTKINTGIATTKYDVYTLDSDGTSTTIRRIHAGLVNEGYTGADDSFYISNDTAYVPVGKEGDAYWLSETGLGLVWDPQSGLCVDGCQGIDLLAEQALKNKSEDSLWRDIECWDAEPEEMCTADDFERLIIKKAVEGQGNYNSDGTLRQDAKTEIFDTWCGKLSSTFSEDCLSEGLKDLVEDVTTAADLASTLADFFEFRKGLRAENCFDSFRADTRVLLANGDTIAIKDIRPGQQVLAGDPASQAAAAQAVTAVHVHTDTELTDLTLTDGSVVHTTPHHPFWTPEQQVWTDAQDLVTDTRLSSPGGAATHVRSVHNFTGSMTMYNLTVDRLHTYYVMAGNTPVLVHNSSCDPIWTARSNRTSAENAFGHYKDHGKDFPDVQNALQYARKARDWFDNPTPTTLTKVRDWNGDVVRFDPETDYFGVMTKDGTPRTFYKPDPEQHGFPTNLDYFNAQ